MDSEICFESEVIHLEKGEPFTIVTKLTYDSSFNEYNLHSMCKHIDYAYSSKTYKAYGFKGDQLPQQTNSQISEIVNMIKERHV